MSRRASVWTALRSAPQNEHNRHLGQQALQFVDATWIWKSKNLSQFFHDSFSVSRLNNVLYVLSHFSSSMNCGAVSGDCWVEYCQRLVSLLSFSRLTILKFVSLTNLADAWLVFIIDCKCVFKKSACRPNSSLALELFKALMVFVTQPQQSFLN